MGKSSKQNAMAAKIVFGALTKQDRNLIDSIKKMRHLPSHNYAVSIWSGVIDRHSGLIARETEGEVVIRTARQRECLAEFIIRNGESQCDGSPY